jgi:hypothetical protein
MRGLVGLICRLDLLEAAGPLPDPVDTVLDAQPPARDGLTRAG